jgi:hypothetical protein
MKKRFKNWITSIFGILIMLGALLWKFVPSVAKSIEEMTEYSLSTFDFVLLMVVGWIFLSAKDSLITGILGGIVKVKAKFDDDGDVEKDAG